MSIGDFFKKIGDEFKKIGGGIGHLFVSIFGQQASQEFVQSAEKILASDFGKIIMSIVEGLTGVAASQGGTTAAAQALAQIKTAATAAGLDIKDSLINLLIDLAVNKMKGTLADITTATSGGAA